MLRIASETLAHRLSLTSKSKCGGASKRDIVAETLAGLKVPA